MKVYYYPYVDSGPVGAYLDALAEERPKAFARLAVDLEILGEEGLRSGRITVRPLGNSLWELKRHYEGTHYRIFFSIAGGDVWLLHAIEKKKAKTPNRDLELARKRQKGLNK